MKASSGNSPRPTANNTERTIWMARCWVRPISTPKPNRVPVASAMNAASPNRSRKKRISTSWNSAAHSHSSSQVSPVKATANASVNPFCQACSNRAA